MPAFVLFPRVPLWRPLCRYARVGLAVALPALSPLSAAAPAGTAAPAPDDSSCQQLYNAGSPALFDFVRTRASVDFSQYAGMQIGTIDYVVLPIFNENDPDEDNWLYRTANWLHIETRPKTLKKQMIIASGETLDLKTLTENERLLRNNEYLVDAMIVPRQVCGNRLDLLVVVRDIWTFSPTASASVSGGEESSGAGISETNLFGLGQRLTMGYYQNTDRNGTTLGYRNPLLPGHNELYLSLADSSDGERVNVAVTHPFYELNSHWSAGTSVFHEQLIQHIKSNGTEINRFNQISENYQAFVGWSRGRQHGAVTRWQAGFTDSSETFGSLTGTTSLPTDEHLRYPWLSWSYQEDRFQTADNINRTHRQEDIQLGFSHYVELGYASTSLGSDEDAVIAAAWTSFASYVGHDHLVRTYLYANGQGSGSEVSNTFFGGSAQYYYFINEKNRWYTSVRFDGAHNIRQDQQLTIGGIENLRGYPNDYQRGNRRWVLSTERRRFTNWHIFNLAYVGVAGYLDAGRAWDNETPLGADQHTLADVGVGLRLSPSKFRIDKIIHVDIAKPLVDRDLVDSYQIIVSGRVDF